MSAELDVQSTLTFLQSLCTQPEQLQMLNWMASQPQEKVVAFLQNAIKTVPRESIPELINLHMATQSPEVRNQIYTQVMQAYDFLNQQQ